MTRAWLAAADGASPWEQATVVVAGLGVSGFAAADGLLEFGATVVVVDDAQNERTSDNGRLLETLGATVRLGPGSSATLPPTADLVITTGWSPAHPLLVEAAARSVPIWSEVELAWRLARPTKDIPWLGVTGTNGKTTTTQMLEAMLRAAGLRTAAVGNIGRPVMETVLDPEPYDVLAVELSSHQLHWSNSLALHSAAVLNLQADHLEWHGSFDDYRAAKAKIYTGVAAACVYNVADPATERMVEEAEVVEGARAIGFTLGTPGDVDARGRRRPVGRSGVHRAAQGLRPRAGQDQPTCGPPRRTTSRTPWPRRRWPAPSGCRRTAVREGLQRVVLGAHKIETVSERDGVRFVDDSKATNPARRRRRPAGLRLGGLDRRRSGQGHRLRRPGAAPSKPAPGGRLAGRRSRRDRRFAGQTRA